MKMKRYIKPEMKEHIPVTPFELYLTGISGSAPHEPAEGEWDSKRRGSFYLDDTSIEEDGTFFQSIYEPCH